MATSNQGEELWSPVPTESFLSLAVYKLLALQVGYIICFCGLSVSRAMLSALATASQWRLLDTCSKTSELRYTGRTKPTLGFKDLEPRIKQLNIIFAF